MPRTQVAVVGAASASAEIAELAFAVGRLLAQHGATLVCGGLTGVMEAAARGAREGGGTTIGILPGESRAEANEWIDYAIPTGIGHARNLAVAASGDVVIAVGGEWGTVSEIALARKLGRPVIALAPGILLEGEGIYRAQSAEEAVELALSLAGRTL